MENFCTFGDIKIRPDREAGVIRARFDFRDDGATFEIGTMSIVLADGNKEHFNAWVEWVKGVVERIGADAGCSHVLIDERNRAPERN